MCKSTEKVRSHVWGISMCADYGWAVGDLDEDISFEEIETFLFINDAVEGIRKVVCAKTNKIVGVMFRDNGEYLGRLEKPTEECERCRGGRQQKIGTDNGQ